MKILTVDSQRVSINDKIEPKIYRARAFGSDSVIIEEIYSQRRFGEPELFSLITIDSISYATQNDTINALNLIVYAGNSEISAGIQQPLSVSGDSVYNQDIDFECSESINWTGNLTDLFESPFSASVINASAENPKSIKLCFKRTIKALQIGLGENNGGNFSNVKLSLIGSGGTVRSIFDESLDNSKKTSLNMEFKNEVFNSILIEFYTADEISLSNIIIFKAEYNISQIQGEDPKGNIRTFQASALGNFKVALAEYQGDAFGRLRVSEPYTIFDSSLTNIYADSLFWSELINGTAASAYDIDNSTKGLTVSANNDYIVRQTKQRFKYQPGKSHEVLITGVLKTELNTIKRVGLVDYDNKGLTTITNAVQNGIYFENNNGVLSWNIVKNGIVTETALSDEWNIDKCDGQGPSEFLLDIDSTNIFFLDLEWLGVGAVRCGFVASNGAIVIAHQFQHASKGFDDVYMRTANLPVSYSLTSSGGSGSMKCICSSVISEGGFNPRGVMRGVESLISGVVIAAATCETVLGIRLKEEDFEYSVAIQSLSILAESSGDGRWYLLFNPTLNGTPAFSDSDQSIIQESLSNLQVTDKGVVIAAGTYSSDNDSISADVENALKLGKSLSGNLDEIWLCVYSYSTETLHGTLNIRELI